MTGTTDTVVVAVEVPKLVPARVTLYPPAVEPVVGETGEETKNAGAA